MNQISNIFAICRAYEKKTGTAICLCGDMKIDSNRARIYGGLDMTLYVAGGARAGQIYYRMGGRRPYRHYVNVCAPGNSLTPLTVSMLRAVGVID